MKVALSHFSLYEWFDYKLMFHFAMISLKEVGGDVVWWNDLETNRTIIEVQERPRDIPVAGVTWDVIEG